MKKGIIISAFPGTGKSFLFKKGTFSVCDSDSSTFDKANFPENYIEAIRKNRKKYDYILISSHEEVREAVQNEFGKFHLVYPSTTCKQEYLVRYKRRGSSKKFIELMDRMWSKFLNSCSSASQKSATHWELQRGKYLSDLPIFK